MFVASYDPGRHAAEPVKVMDAVTLVLVVVPVRSTRPLADVSRRTRTEPAQSAKPYLTGSEDSSIVANRDFGLPIWEMSAGSERRTESWQYERYGSPTKNCLSSAN